MVAWVRQRPRGKTELERVRWEGFLMLLCLVFSLENGRVWSGA